MSRIGRIHHESPRSKRPRPRKAADFDLAADRERAMVLTNVSRETLARLDRFVALLLQWQAKTNLIAPSTIPHLWTRHIADSLQLLELAPDARHWVDLGSGGGFPGLVLAIALAKKPNSAVDLVEINAKKASFLREVVRATGAPATVHCARIESFVETFAGVPDIVTARALAPLARLIELSYPLLHRGARALFPKGQDVEAELTEATKYWNMNVTLIPSRTDPQARIVDISRVAPQSARPATMGRES